MEKSKEFIPQGDIVFALDIGTRTVVGILGEYIDEKFILKDYCVQPHTKRAMIDGQIEDIKQVGKIVSAVKKKLEERNGIRLEKVSIAAAGRALRTLKVSMDFDVSEKENITSDMVKSMEIETMQKAQEILDGEHKNASSAFYCVGHSVVKYLLDDYKIITLEGHKGEKASVEIIAAFLPSVVVEGLYAVVERNRLTVQSLTLEPIAAMNVIVPPEIRLINIALVDIGAGTSDIAIAREGSIYAYAMATTAGDEITEEIIKTYLVSFDEAERMKHSYGVCDEIEYTDIFGLKNSVSSSELGAKITPSIDALADTICQCIVEVNGNPPSAVFLVGGGSLISGLTALISEKLGIDERRVAVGGHEFLKNVETNGEKLGAEFVTPFGIGVTAMLNQGYDFSLITVNDENIRIFDTKQLNVYELLLTVGYKTSDIMGRSGLSLNFMLNAKRTTIRGGNFTPAEVYVNGASASVTTKVTQGDNVRFIPAKNGENAERVLSDLSVKTEEITVNGVPYKIGKTALVNGTQQDDDYKIKQGDEIVTREIVTVGDLFAAFGLSPSGIIKAGKKIVNREYVLIGGDAIEFNT